MAADWWTRKCLRDFDEPAGKFFHTLCYFICVVGVVANVLTVFVMRRPALRKSSTSIFLINLAIFDLLKLITGLIMVAEDTILPRGTKTIFTSTPSCAFFMFFQKFSTNTAIWLVATVTIERFVIVYHPLQAKTITTRRNAKIFVGVVAAINLLANLDYLITTKYDDKIRDCDSRTYHKEHCEYRTYFKGIAECIWKLLPLLLNVILNTLIIAKVRFHTPKRMLADRQDSMKRHNNDSTRSNHNQLLKMLLTVSIVSTCLLIPPNVNSAIRKSSGTSKCTSSNVSTSFSNASSSSTSSSSSSSRSLPQPIDNSTSANDKDSKTEKSYGNGKSSNCISGKCTSKCVETILKTYIAGRPFFLLNHAVNFFLYIISGRAFRREFLKMVSEWKQWLTKRCCCCCGNDEAGVNAAEGRRRSSWWITSSSKVTTKTSL